MFCPYCGNQSQGEQVCLGCGRELPKRPGSTAVGSASAVDSASAVGSARAVDSSFDKLIGRILDQKYQLEARLDVDATGTIYRAKRLLIGDLVAVKILHPELMNNPSAVERFNREAQASALIKHPNVVAIYDFRVSPNNLVYLVMELVEGVSLRKMIEQQGALSQESAVMIAHQVCETLAEAHKHGVIHRDLRPENILIQSAVNGQQIKVLNFGIAALRDLNIGDAEQSGGSLINAAYMSPEQCRGDNLDVRSDIYSLGIVLYEMLTGVTPFKSHVLTAVVVQQVTQPPPPLRHFNAGISPAIESLVLRALDKSRRKRPQTISEFALSLTKASHGVLPLVEEARPIAPTPIKSPAQPIPDSAAYLVSADTLSSGNFAVAPKRRSRRGLWLFVVTLLLLVAGGSIWWWYAKSGRANALTKTRSDIDSAQPAPTASAPATTASSPAEVPAPAPAPTQPAAVPASQPGPSDTTGSLWELITGETSGATDAVNALGSPDQKLAVIAPGKQIAMAYREGQFFGNGPGADLRLHGPNEIVSYEIFVRNDSVSTWRRVDTNRRGFANGVFNHDIGHHGVQQARQVMIKNTGQADLKLDAVTAQYKNKVISTPKPRPKPRPIFVDRKELEKARKKREKELEKRREERRKR